MIDYGTPKKVHFTVDLPRLFNEIATNPGTSVTRFPLQYTLNVLARLAQHALDTGDKEALELLETLSIVDRSGGAE